METKIDGYTIQIDAEDLPLIEAYRWYFRKQDSYVYRTVRTKERNKTIYLHREIIKTPKGMLTDHVNGDRLDYRKSNLRACSSSENNQNRGRMTNNTLGVTGLSFYPKKAYNQWRATIMFSGAFVHLGYFQTKEEATAARKAAEKVYFRSFARNELVDTKTEVL